MSLDELWQAILEPMEIMKIFDEVRKDVALSQKENSPNFKSAKNICMNHIYSPKDNRIKVKAYQAFAACYEDLGLEDKASEMTQKWQDLADEHLEF